MKRFAFVVASLLLLSACSTSAGDGGITTPQSIAVGLSATSGTVTSGTSTTTTLSLTRVGGFAGLISLTVESVPNGVSVMFSPTQLSGSTTTAGVAITVATAATPGTNTIIIRATGTGVSAATTPYTLTIAAPPTPAITLTAGSSTVNTAQGASATIPITITRSGGFADVVTLAAEGLPTGVTPSFAPTSFAAGVTSGTLTLAVSAVASAGTTSFTIRASGAGVTAQTATVALTIAVTIAPDYSLTATPASLPITAGQSGTSAVTVTRTGGFAANVQLSLDGAPAGVSGVFAPNPATAGTSTLTVSTTAATVPGTYNLTVRGTAGQTDRTTTITVVVSPIPAITLAVGSPTLSATVGASVTSTVTIARVGTFVGDVALSLDAPPVGVTAVFTPATIATGGTTASVSISAGSTAVPGIYTLTVRGTGTGISAQTATITLTIVAAPTFTLTATAVTTPQSTTGTSTVTLTRTGGFTGAVSLALAGLPTGVTATFTPSSVTGTSTSLSLAIASTVAVGTYTGTITGSATGLSNVTTPVSLIVTQGSTATGAISWQFCDVTQFPVWFAFRNGTTGTWTRVTASANQTYNFTMSGAVGGVAYAQPVVGSPPQVTITLATVAEFATAAAAECTTNRATKTLNGTFAGLAASQTGSVNLGGAFASTTFPSTAFQLSQVDEGITDVVAFRSVQAFANNALSIVADRAVLRRNVNYAANSTIPVIDFSGSESFPVQTAQIVTANAGSEAVNVLTSFVTSNGSFGGFAFGALQGGTSPYVVFGIPGGLLQNGDLHLVSATASNFAAQGVGTLRIVGQYNRDLVNRTLSFGPVLNLPTFVTVATQPYARIQGSGFWQAEYGDRLFGSFVQNTGNSSRTWTISGTRGYFGPSVSYNFDIPDFSTVQGFDVSWGLQAGVLTNVTASGTGITSGGGQIIEGASFRVGAVIGVYQP